MPTESKRHGYPLPNKCLPSYLRNFSAPTLKANLKLRRSYQPASDCGVTEYKVHIVAHLKNGFNVFLSVQHDEAHFWLNGYVNKQNCRIWSEANPQVYVETPLHPEKLTVWCALWAGGILLQKR
ncbi:hypothetical protein TNCV_1843681 [Trichonephila clavipes]|nr:hypothetical protein TNCV_1843681 [Trichonephila clavipes]